MAKRLYIDTSAYLNVLLGERGSDKLERELSGAWVLSSVLLVLEARRNLIRLSREGVLSAPQLERAFDRLEQDLEFMVLRDLTLELCLERTFPAVSTPRSLDLAHLRTACWFHQREPLTRFVTVDDAQRIAARELGLPTGH